MDTSAVLSKAEQNRTTISGTDMPDEINEGVAYLLALKQTSGHTATAPTLAKEVKPPDPANTFSPAENEFKGTEKRRSPRYKCEGSVEVREQGCEVRTWASFTDVSMHGCYVEAQATYPAGTLLQMKLEANGIRVETKGMVRVNYPYLGMGISFEEMSDEEKEHLKRLLATLSHHCVIMGPGIASSLPANEPLQAVPLISDPAAAVQALIEFFETRQMLMREDFLRILRRSQTKG